MNKQRILLKIKKSTKTATVLLTILEILTRIINKNNNSIGNNSIIIYSPPIYLYKIIITNIEKLTISTGLIFRIINYIELHYLGGKIRKILIYLFHIPQKVWAVHPKNIKKRHSQECLPLAAESAAPTASANDD